MMATSNREMTLGTVLPQRFRALGGMVPSFYPHCLELFRALAHSAAGADGDNGTNTE